MCLRKKYITFYKAHPVITVRAQINANEQEREGGNVKPAFGRGII